MKVIGLTGGIATGKSTAATFFRNMDIPIVDVDDWAHRLLMPGQINYNRVVQAFGPQILHEDKTIDRRSLGRIVFAEPKLRKQLEELTHPAIIKAIKEELNDLRGQKVPVVILDHPLLYETGMDQLVDEVWVVATSPGTQRARLAARDGLSENEADQRLAAQMSLKEKVRRADLVLSNDGCREEFQALLVQTWKERILCNLESHS